MKFSKAFLLDRLGSDDTVQRTYKGKRRWSIDYREIFKHDGKFYETTYSEGATESQDEQPYSYEDDEIECPEVEPFEETVIVYKPVLA